MAALLPYIFAFLVTVSTVNSLTCYTCDTNKSGLCGWGLASFTYDSQECPSAGVLDSFIGAKCFKIKAENKEGKEYIARGCLPPGTVGCSAIASAIGWIGSISQDAESLSQMSCDTCTTDKCNSAQMITGVTLIALIISGAVFIF